MKQLLYNVRFNLRTRKANKPTYLYCVVYADGKQYKFTTGVKVLPKQWDNIRQLAVISNVQSKIDNHNNNMVNEKLDEFKQSFTNYLEYLCISENENFNYYSLKTYMYKTPAITPSELIVKAYDYLYKGKAVHNTYKPRLNSYLRYLAELKITTLDSFTQSGFNAYKKYLIDNNTTKVTVNNNCQLVAKLVNDVLAVEEPFLQYGIAGNIKYNKEKDVRPEKGRFPLTDDEVALIENLQINDDTQFSFEDVAPKSKDGKVNNKYRTHKNGKILKQYRDIFVLQCRCGQRVSDLMQFLTGQYEIMTTGSATYYKISTIKSQKKIESFIRKDNYITGFLEKYKGGFDIDVNRLDAANSYYNLAIKKVCKLCSIDRIITYRDAHDIEHKNKVYEIIVSHDARHTFITKMILKGMSADKLCYLTGHTDDAMIKRIYTHLTSENKVAILDDELDKSDDKPAALQSLFAYDDLLDIERLIKAGVDVRQLPQTEKVATIIKDSSTLSSYKEIDGSKAKELDRLVFYLAYLLKDKQLYAVYQYKLKYYGIIDKTDDVDRLFMPRQYKKAEDLLDYKEIPDIKDVEKALNERLNKRCKTGFVL